MTPVFLFSFLLFQFKAPLLLSFFLLFADLLSFGLHLLTLQL
jgi:hypothetical protein